MGRVRYTETFKVEAVRQVTEGGYGVYDVASRLGISNKSLYDWIKVYGPDSKTTQTTRADHEELRKLRAELKRVTQERDLLKEAARYFAQESK
jgi:transposase